jgi:hypothetical protein
VPEAHPTLSGGLDGNRWRLTVAGGHHMVEPARGDEGGKVHARMTFFAADPGRLPELLDYLPRQPLRLCSVVMTDG